MWQAGELVVTAGFSSLTSSIYGSTVSRMKTTFDIPDELMVRAKKRAAELRKPLRVLVTEGLRAQLAGAKGPSATSPAVKRKIKWVTAPGGLPPDLDLTSREQMHDWLRRQR